MITKSRAQPLLIGRIAARTGVHIETIRYYERVGLLPAPPRTPGRHRVYEERHARRLSFIRRSRELGFSLDDIRALLQIADDEGSACADAKDVALRHLADIRGKIASLEALEAALRRMTRACRPGRQVPCPIIETLSAS